jgi:hypothetical protein
MKTVTTIKIVLLGIIIIALAVWAGILIAGTQSSRSNSDGPSPYSAVYLSTGDIYFGKLSWFPAPHMTDVWFIERSQDQNGQAQTNIASLKSVFWGPVDEINLNAQDILFSTRLKNSSQIVTVIENPASLEQQGEVQGAPGAMSSSPAVSSTTGTQ